jgi:hypothetical protein
MAGRFTERSDGLLFLTGRRRSPDMLVAAP